MVFLIKKAFLILKSNSNQDLADAMKVTSEDTARDLELSTDMLLDRARQLGQLNTEELAEKSSGYYSIKRQLKTAK